MTYRVAISGSYGGMNLGDEAILSGILRELCASTDLDIVVFSQNPKDTEKRHGVRAVPSREMHRDQVIEELKKLDLFILGGGGILFDGVVESFLRDVVWAKEIALPVIVYAISAGPLKLPESRRLVKEALNQTDIITVRESESKTILNDLGVTIPIEVTADPAFLMEPKPFTEKMLTQEGINLDRRLVGFSVREPGPAAPDLDIDHYHGMIANAADFLIERYHAQILFLPMELADLQHAHAVISNMSNLRHANVLKNEWLSAEILGLMQHMSFVVAMRLHVLIFASLQGIPFIPLPYASKVTGLLQDLKMPMPPIEQWNSGKLCAVLDRAWDSHRVLRNKLQKQVPLLRAKAKRSNEIVADFLKSLTPKHE